MSDGLFYVVALVFFFILWAVSGGPTRPISFAGPFITPITNEGQTQKGYGPQLGGTLSAFGGSTSASVHSGTAPKIPDTSTYTGHVYLTHEVSGLDSSNPADEYLEIGVTNTTSGTVDISGWKVESTITGASAIIPQGVQMLQLGTVSLAPIALTPGNTATITTGPSPVNVSFEQNSCSSYLTNAANYSQCYETQNTKSNFLSGVWRIYVNKNARLWKNSGDTIELVDSGGKVVDNFSY